MGSEENAVGRQVCELLERLGIPHHRVHCGSVPVRRGYLNLGEPGWPDLVAILPGGRSWFIETKTPKGKFKDTQPQVHERLRAQGALVTVARRLEDVLPVLDEARRAG